MSNGPIYTTPDSVKIRLSNKVRFVDENDPSDDRGMPNALLCQLIMDAEMEVEQDLRSRYCIPFQHNVTGRYSDLPDHTQRAIRTVVDFMAVVKVLETDFGSGSHINADGYAADQRQHYEDMITKLLGRDKEAAVEAHDRYRFSPPLEALKLAPTNLADDGVRGSIINTSNDSCSPEQFAIDSINDPSISYQGTARRRR